MLKNYVHIYRKIFCQLLAAICILFSVLSCGDGSNESDVDESEQEVEQASISLSETNLIVSRKMGENYTYVLEVSSSNASWNLSIDQAWLTADIESGDSSANITLNVNDWALVEAGENQTVVTVKDSNSDVSASLTFTLLAEAKRIFLSERGIAFSRLGDFSKLEKVVELYTSFGALGGNVSIVSSANWIESSITNNLVSINIDDTQLSEGFHEGQLVLKNDDVTVRNDLIINIGFYKQAADWNNLTINIPEHIRELTTNPVFPHTYVYTLTDGIQVFHSYSGQYLFSIDLQGTSQQSLMVDPSGKKLYVGANDMLRVYSVSNEEIQFVESIVFNTGYRPALINANGMTVIISDDNDLNTSVLDVESLELLDRSGNFGNSFDPLYAGSKKQEYVYSINSGVGGNTMPLIKSRVEVNAVEMIINITPVDILDSEFFNYGRELAISPDDSKVYVVASGYGINVVDSINNQLSYNRIMGSSRSYMKVDSIGNLFQPSADRIDKYDVLHTLVDSIALPFGYEIISERLVPMVLSSDEHHATVIYSSDESTGIMMLKLQE